MIAKAIAQQERAQKFKESVRALKESFAAHRVLLSMLGVAVAVAIPVTVAGFFFMYLDVGTTVPAKSEVAIAPEKQELKAVAVVEEPKIEPVKTEAVRDERPAPERVKTF